MKIYILSLAFVLALAAAFSALNWSLIVEPADLSLGLVSVQMPLGLVMLGLLFVITLLFLVFVIYLQTSALLENRRYSRELQTSRELADKAEVSRFTELRNILEAEMQKQRDLSAASNATLLAKADELCSELRISIEQSGNTLAAYIGELEDRLEKKNPSAI